MFQDLEVAELETWRLIFVSPHPSKPFSNLMAFCFSNTHLGPQLHGLMNSRYCNLVLVGYRPLLSSCITELQTNLRNAQGKHSVRYLRGYRAE
jgi:hypothetical protein